jgi:glyoxylase-like metal-dependent hydrolase (beta-lactamase superfamily II)
LHASAHEVDAVSKHGRVDVAFDAVRHVDEHAVEVIPTPGHSRGSTCYLVSGADGAKYLFTGDTMFPTADGSWATFVVPGRGDPAAIRDSLKVLATVQPDLVISSAFGGPTAVEVIVDPRRWHSASTRRWRACLRRPCSHATSIVRSGRILAACQRVSSSNLRMASSRSPRS